MTVDPGLRSLRATGAANRNALSVAFHEDVRDTGNLLSVPTLSKLGPWQMACLFSKHGAGRTWKAWHRIKVASNIALIQPPAAAHMKCSRLSGGRRLLQAVSTSVESWLCPSLHTCRVSGMVTPENLRLSRPLNDWT